MRKGITTPELIVCGIVLFAIYLAVLWARSGLSSAESAIITGLVVIFIEVLLIGFAHFAKRLRRARRSQTQTLAKTPAPEGANGSFRRCQPAANRTCLRACPPLEMLSTPYKAEIARLC